MSTIAHGSVVVGIDGSAPSGGALDWAIDEASRRRLPLHLVHAYGIDYSIAAALISSPDPSEVSDGLLDAALARVRSLAPSLRASVEASTSLASRVLVELSSHADTVVVGARGRGALRGALLGSVSLQVAMHAQCPVVVVRELPIARPTTPRVVVGIDGSPISRRVVEYAFAQAAARGLGLTVVHAWWLEFVEGVVVTTSSSEQWAQVAESKRLLVSESLVGWGEKYPEVDVRKHIVRKLPVETLVDESEGAELLVVGSRGRGGFKGLLLGSVSHAVLQRAHCPVAVVRPRHDEQ